MCEYNVTTQERPGGCGTGGSATATPRVPFLSGGIGRPWLIAQADAETAVVNTRTPIRRIVRIDGASSCKNVDEPQRLSNVFAGNHVPSGIEQYSCISHFE
jgi:hypothetical protein